METYTKINTLYRRYKMLGDCPNPKWKKMQNKIILGCYSDPVFGYLMNCLFEGYSKIDGTNSKICFLPSTGKVQVGGKTDKASSQHGQFEMLQEIADRIQPELVKMFPKENAVFAPAKGDDNKVQYYSHVNGSKIDTPSLGIHSVWLEEVPIYIYGEYFGTGVQKCGSRYIQNGNGFRVFDIKQQGWWTPKDVRDSICKGLGLQTVPFLGVMTLEEIENKVRAGFTTQFEGAADPTMLEEGIVARPVIPLCDGSGNRIIVKVKYCDYIEYDAVRKEFSDKEFEEFDTWYHENIENIKIG